VVDRKNLPDYESLTRRARNTSEPVRGIYRKTVALSPGLGSVKVPLSIPAHRPIKSFYIKRFVALIDQIQE
jgi:hypothetical protein